MNTFVLVIFVLLPALGAILGARKLRLVLRGRRVTGRIVAHERRETTSDADQRYIDYPVVEFADENGRKVRKTMSGEPPEGDNTRGSPVKLIHLRGRAAGAEFDNPVTLWLIPAICFGPAAVLALYIVLAFAWAKVAA